VELSLNEKDGSMGPILAMTTKKTVTFGTRVAQFSRELGKDFSRIGICVLWALILIFLVVIGALVMEPTKPVAVAAVPAPVIVPKQLSGGSMFAIKVLVKAPVAATAKKLPFKPPRIAEAKKVPRPVFDGVLRLAIEETQSLNSRAEEYQGGYLDGRALPKRAFLAWLQTKMLPGVTKADFFRHEEVNLLDKVEMQRFYLYCGGFAAGVRSLLEDKKMNVTFEVRDSACVLKIDWQLARGK
jgi:hypothetical protein